MCLIFWTVKGHVLVFLAGQLWWMTDRSQLTQLMSLRHQKCVFSFCLYSDVTAHQQGQATESEQDDYVLKKKHPHPHLSLRLHHWWTGAINGPGPIQHNNFFSSFIFKFSCQYNFQNNVNYREILSSAQNRRTWRNKLFRWDSIHFYLLTGK